ncbi:hypothetical protein ACWE42_21200 [Sutcliffiella cohnii]
MKFILSFILAVGLINPLSVGATSDENYETTNYEYSTLSSGTPNVPKED